MIMIEKKGINRISDYCLNLRKYRTMKFNLRMNLLLSTLQKQATQRQITRKCFVY